MLNNNRSRKWYEYYTALKEIEILSLCKKMEKFSIDDDSDDTSMNAPVPYNYGGKIDSFLRSFKSYPESP